MTPQYWKRIQKGIFAGESGGDYNALFNYQNRPDGRFAGVDLQNMTIDQALDFANPSGEYGQYVKGQVGHIATPMGAYQIVGSTLRDAKRGLDLKGDELMTPEMQDRLGQWIYKKQGTGAWAGYKPEPNAQDIADQTMTALGKGPRGILAAPEPEAQPMIANQQPQGLLGSLGVQKMQPGAEGETGQRFYERDTFKDTAARMAQGFAALGGNPAVQKFAADVAAQRTEGKARNKTVDYLRKAGRPDIAEMLKNKVIKPSEAVQFLTGGGNVQSSQALPDQSGVIMTMRDGSIAVKTVGGETLQGQTALDFVNQAQEAYAEQQRDIYGARAVGKGEGQRRVDEAIDVAERQRNIGSLRVVVDQLNALSDTATYTLLGQAANEVKKQLGLVPSEGAIARSEYIAVVDNQILPLLRETFGAAFTVKEGETLRATLGDPNKTPAEKKVVLDAFIAQKERDLQARTGQPAPQVAPSGGGPKRLKFNPETGGFDE
jgi:hypothetical protein